LIPDEVAQRELGVRVRKRHLPKLSHRSALADARPGLPSVTFLE
jgi:hypothetical protein